MSARGVLQRKEQFEQLRVVLLQLGITDSPLQIFQLLIRCLHIFLGQLRDQLVALIHHSLVLLLHPLVSQAAQVGIGPHSEGRVGCVTLHKEEVFQSRPLPDGGQHDNVIGSQVEVLGKPGNGTLAVLRAVHAHSEKTGLEVSGISSRSLSSLLLPKFADLTEKLFNQIVNGAVLRHLFDSFFVYLRTVASGMSQSANDAPNSFGIQVSSARGSFCSKTTV
mmetsp:Transcript_11971/g.22997  ORF Transcript_11971/g.22997 Transcript_11971/m.22997 type:complete len:221 (-) Transcript_11971:77-739(-)